VVYVMDDLVGLERAPDHLLCYTSMLVTAAHFAVRHAAPSIALSISSLFCRFSSDRRIAFRIVVNLEPALA